MLPKVMEIHIPKINCASTRNFRSPFLDLLSHFSFLTQIPGGSCTVVFQVCSDFLQKCCPSFFRKCGPISGTVVRDSESAAVFFFRCHKSFAFHDFPGSLLFSDCCLLWLFDVCCCYLLLRAAICYLLFALCLGATQMFNPDVQPRCALLQPRCFLAQPRCFSGLI